MPYLFENLPRLLYRASQFHDYSSLILQALILLALLIILTRASSIRELLKNFLNTETDGSNPSPANENYEAASTASTSMQVSTDENIPDELLLAILTAAIHTYEAEESMINSHEIQAVMNEVQYDEAIITTAPFVIKSIRRVS